MKPYKRPLIMVPEYPWKSKLTTQDVDVRPKDPVIPKGCQVYHFHGFSCIASSEKAAIKKYNKFKSKL